MRSPTPSLAPTLEAALSRGTVLPHGRLQQLDSRGHVVNDAAPVAEPWRAPLADAVRTWSSMEAKLPGVQLVSVYARGSIVRGLGLPGISDIDTLGYAVVDASSSTSSQLRAWRLERAAALRAAHPVASGFDLELVAAPRGSRLGLWLLGDIANADALLPSDLHELDAFRLKTQALHVHGEQLHARLPGFAPRPRLVLALPRDAARAAREVERLHAAGAPVAKQQAVAQWLLKRCLRSGMELAARDRDGFSRDLLPCYEAIAAHLPARTATLALDALQVHLLLLFLPCYLPAIYYTI